MKIGFIRVVSAEYAGGLSLKLTFSDGTVKSIDFSEYLLKNPHPQHERFLDASEFMKFRVENGNVVWGKDWDLVFPIEDLYNCEIF